MIKPVFDQTVTVMKVVSICLLSALGSASANTAANVSTTLNSNLGSPAYMDDSDTQNQPGITPSFVQSTLVNALAGYYTNHTSANADARPGIIRLYSASDAVAADPGAPSYVTAIAQSTITASWNDTFTIDGGALNGQTGQLIAGFLVGGSLISAFDNSVAFQAIMDNQFPAQIRLTDRAGHDLIIQGGQRHTASYSGDIWGSSFGFPVRAPGLWTITFDFNFGSPIDVSSWADATTKAQSFAVDVPPYPHPPYPVSSIMATADFPSIRWNGITSITDSLGNPVTNYTITSVSGFDYALPAPETQCVVDLQDYAKFASGWLESGCDQTNDWCQGVDLDLNHAVDLSDLQKFSDSWLAACPPDWPWQ